MAFGFGEKGAVMATQTMIAPTKVKRTRKPRTKAVKPVGPPTDEDSLYAWITQNTGLCIPRKAICPHHNSPFDYIRAAYLDEADMVVWAPRGGGKTTLGALATLLDIVHKPSCQVRILGGSMEQSLRMWEQLLPMIESAAADKLAGTVRARAAKLTNGSGVAVLAQSQRSVRGQRVQRLRCDEVELFEPSVWRAAQMVTRSRTLEEMQKLSGGAFNRPIRGSIEALSTMHEPYGLMQEIVDQAQLAGRRVIKWCLLDVLEKCVGRECDSCGLLPECKGAAREAEGFLRIDDALAMKRRVSRETWEAEMLCLRPSRKDAVFPQFKTEIHVSEIDWWSSAGESGIKRALGVDFGYRNPFVCLWILSDVAGRVYVMDEYVSREKALEAHALALKARHSGYSDIFCDPAGNATNSQTSRSDVEVLRQMGFRVSAKGTRVQDGIDAIKTALQPALGEVTLRIHPRCRELIRSLECYHYKRDDGRETPDKDNINDHCIDALRYYFVGRPKTSEGAKSY